MITTESTIKSSSVKTRKKYVKPLEEHLRNACRKIAPVWPLENFVAVNPYLGLADHSFDHAASLLARVGGVQMTLPVSFYKKALEEGRMQPGDLADILAEKNSPCFQDLEQFMDALENDQEDTIEPQIATVADIAREVTGKDWNRLVTDRISLWAAAYFDKGQASWTTAQSAGGLYNSWRQEASVDMTPEIMGLKGFTKQIKGLPDNPLEAARLAIKKLDIPSEYLDNYLHRLLFRVGGWSAYAARLDWERDIYGGKDEVLPEFLCVLLAWEVTLLTCLEKYDLRTIWKRAIQSIDAEQGRTLHKSLVRNLILQEAYDRSAQRTLIQQFKTPGVPGRVNPKVQAVFCIDVRSEVFRRNLEMVAPEVETLGFAGFFGFPVKYVPLGHDGGNAQCPVLLPAGPVVREEIPGSDQHHKALQKRRRSHHLQRAWKSFKLGAISCFSFVGPVGLSYLPKLFTDAFGLTRPVPHPDKESLSSWMLKKRKVSIEPSEHSGVKTGIDLTERIHMAKSALEAMSLTDKFANLVLIVGHGSSTVNNPYATGLDCGACGGHTGEANARVAATILNDENVRQGLAACDIFIPADTYFIAAQHDTTTDEVTLFDEDDIPSGYKLEVNDLRDWLKKAGQAARTERATRLGIHGKNNPGRSVIARSRDWAQVRPEWGLAGCSAFVVAPRERTQRLDLSGRSFLHSYEWKKDDGFKVLELIMTAPMIVTSWINLQYYASTVDNNHYGSGNKTLHNVTGGIGVLEGFAGDLRTGLPWQSVHDGKDYQHEPLRLNVVIEAPIEAMNSILQKHEQVRMLCDNQWIYLLAMNDQGQVTHKYTEGLEWEKVH